MKNEPRILFSPTDGRVFLHRMTGFAYRTLYPEFNWFYNPWTGKPRHWRDVQSDPRGIFIVPPVRRAQ